MIFTKCIHRAEDKDNGACMHSQSHMQGRPIWPRTKNASVLKIRRMKKILKKKRRKKSEYTSRPLADETVAQQRAPYPVTPCIRSAQHHRPVYYAWPAGEMTRDILLTQQDGHILTAASGTGAEMSLSVLAQSVRLLLCMFVRV